MYGKIVSASCAFPKKRYSNQEFIKKYQIDSTEEWISQMTGIEYRYFVEDFDEFEQIAIKAAMQVSKNSKIDAIIVASSTFYHFPGLSHIIHKHLGCSKITRTLDINAACNGFMQALSIANDYIKFYGMQNVVVVGADAMSLILDMNDRSTACLFADGAGAVLVSACKDYGMQYWSHQIFSENYQALIAKEKIQMNGRMVFESSVKNFVQVVEATLKLANISKEEVDLFVFHQANVRIFQKIAKDMGIPHLILPVVTEPKEAIQALKWVVKEMEERYIAMSKLGVRNILTFNAKIEQLNQKDKKLPFIVIVVDEMADLMLVAGKEIEICVQRLAQMGRAAGIHIIMATQRPSVDVITGTIKANFPTRISFKLSSKIDSRTILGDLSGAEQLLGAGDMLYLATDGKLKRIHGSFVSENDVLNIVDFWKKQGAPEYIKLHEADDPMHSNAEFDEPYYKEAIELIRSTKKVSTSFLQRNFPIGYNRAAKIIEQMEKDGIISAGDKFGRNREVL